MTSIELIGLVATIERLEARRVQSCLVSIETYSAVIKDRASGLPIRVGVLAGLPYTIGLGGMSMRNNQIGVVAWQP